MRKGPIRVSVSPLPSLKTQHQLRYIRYFLDKLRALGRPGLKRRTPVGRWMQFRPPLLTVFHPLLDYLSPFWITRFLDRWQAFFAQHQVQSLQQAIQVIPIKVDNIHSCLGPSCFSTFTTRQVACQILKACVCFTVSQCYHTWTPTRLVSLP